MDVLMLIVALCGAEYSASSVCYREKLECYEGVKFKFIKEKREVDDELIMIDCMLREKPEKL